ncbi:sensor histidine kinase [Goodfellowiella coeruleoviolacea]|uniref:sensor histidine kinase n=1 Tax=Goodfellowiella coeruleoviolacea TaxID=334858 RepID=UPI000A9CEDED|nr:histidine kinase [Goodfellowiella coeruleoviolacea]
MLDRQDNGGRQPWWRRLRHSGAVAWIAVALLFELFMFLDVPDILHSGLPPARVALDLGAVLLYAAAYAVLPALTWRADDRTRLVVSAVTLGLGVVTVALLGLAATGLLVYGMAVVAVLAPWRWGVLLDGLVFLALLGAIALWGDVTEDVSGLITLLSVTVALFFMGRLRRAIQALKAAQAEIAAMAVTQERARLARDLHDVLGHSLTTITVKAGLARRVLERAADTDRAIAEVREVEELSRQALADVRATVSGYREVTLAAELVGARAALHAAGVEADLPHAVDNVRPEYQEVFGYVLREGITNVLRHSRASRCAVRLGENWVEISDNGRGTGGVGGSGTGLAGLGERLAAVGGRIEAGPRPEGGFQVRASAGGTDRLADRAEATRPSWAPGLPSTSAGLA